LNTPPPQPPIAETSPGQIDDGVRDLLVEFWPEGFQRRRLAATATAGQYQHRALGTPAGQERAREVDEVVNPFSALPDTTRHHEPLAGAQCCP
jgi:hypothetical protein